MTRKVQKINIFLNNFVKSETWESTKIQQTTTAKKIKQSRAQNADTLLYQHYLFCLCINWPVFQVTLDLLKANHWTCEMAQPMESKH